MRWLDHSPKGAPMRYKRSVLFALTARKPFCVACSGPWLCPLVASGGEPRSNEMLTVPVNKIGSVCQMIHASIAHARAHRNRNEAVMISALAIAQLFNGTFLPRRRLPEPSSSSRRECIVLQRLPCVSYSFCFYR
ncbi:hypothetical protein FA95DRAFT_696055 [Auriscalpium vulgare]|uniref:Uncharacterized protein n=1 Tax=Auriscalpium vulgare TaxID=40419 RepID=A0ACB8RCW4_9AGAM|nr:hypothetical protein FA95DRAFT_696055 [Auriscalpium vulgare]